ncbi:MAG: hypothetical protein QM710_10580 [Flavobacterium sp.]
MDNNQNLLHYLYKLLFLDGIEELMSTYLNNKDLVAEGYDYFEQSGYYMKLDLIESNNNNADLIVSGIVDRQAFLNRFLLLNRDRLYNYFKNLENESPDELEVFLNEYYNLLSNYHNKANSDNGNYSTPIRNEIETIVNDLRIQFPIIEYHKVFKILTKVNDSISIFQPKELKASFFEELYSITCNLDLIDDVLVPEEMFYDVLVSSKPNSESKILFIKKNSLIAYYLKELEPFFYNFNPVSIEKSKCFYNKQNKALNSADLYTSLSRSNNNDEIYFKRITEKINQLKSKHLN